MILISQNLVNYDIPIPKNAVFRINLAWVNSIDQLKELLTLHKKHDIFLDLPTNRTKPPNNRYTLNDISSLLDEYRKKRIGLEEAIFCENKTLVQIGDITKALNKKKSE